MAHQESPEAVDAPVEYTTDSAAAALKEAFAAEEAPEEVEETDDTVEAPEEAGEEEITDADLEESEGEEADEGDEPDAPAIEAPVSLNADEKAVFSQLPPEAQAAWAASEDRRNKQVQEATTKASEAQRNAAETARLEAEKARLDDTEEFLARMLQKPDHSLQQVNPAEYSRQVAQYNEAFPAYQKSMQIIAEQREALETERAEKFRAQRNVQLVQAIPEYVNEEFRKGFETKIVSAAEELGFSIEEVVQDLDARAIIGLSKLAEYKAKADKFDASMKKQMERVRSGKSRSLKPGTAQPKGSSNRAFDQAQQRLKASGSVDDAAAAFKAIL